MTRAIVVVPTYNERLNLPVLADALMQQPDVRLLVVDDQSPDGTGDVAESLARLHPGRIGVIHRTGRRGLGRAYIDGFRTALEEPVDVVCQMDADLSHDPRQLPDLIAAARDADVVIGSRYVSGGRIVNWPKRREVLSRFANVYVRAITRLTTHDCTATRHIGAAAARSFHFRRVFVSDRNALLRRAPRLPDRGDSDYVRGAARGAIEGVARRADRIRDHAVAACPQAFSCYRLTVFPCSADPGPLQA